jgi:hypothetical protein
MYASGKPLKVFITVGSPSVAKGPLTTPDSRLTILIFPSIVPIRIFFLSSSNEEQDTSTLSVNCIS